MESIDIKALNEFLRELYNIIFIQDKKNYNPLDFYSQIITNTRRDCFYHGGLCDPFNINTYMAASKSIFNITYRIINQKPEKIELEITCLENKNKIILFIIHENHQCFSTVSINKDRWEITIDSNSSLPLFLHEFAHIYHYWKSDVPFYLYNRNYMFEVYPMYIENLCPHNDIFLRNTWNSLLTITFLYHLQDTLNNTEDFARTYINTFPENYKKLLIYQVKFL